MLKRLTMLLAAFALMIGILAGCGNNDNKSDGSGKTIDELKVSFVPSKDPDEIITATEPLKKLLKDELKKLGYNVKKYPLMSVQHTKLSVKHFLRAQPMSA